MQQKRQTWMTVHDGQPPMSTATTVRRLTPSCHACDGLGRDALGANGCNLYLTSHLTSSFWAASLSCCAWSSSALCFSNSLASASSRSWPCNSGTLCTRGWEGRRCNPDQDQPRQVDLSSHLPGTLELRLSLPTTGYGAFPTTGSAAKHRFDGMFSEAVDVLSLFLSAG